jgi:predicted ribonuclease YlaK
VYCVAEEVDEYCGFQDLTFNTQDSIAEFYENIDENCFNLLPNEYAILRDSSGAIIDRVCWTGETHRPLKFQTFSSKWFNVKPMKGDIYQQFVADSFLNNKITMVKGPAGSGKTLMSLGFLFD